MLKPDVVAPGLRLTGPLARSGWETCSPPPCNGVFCNKNIASYAITNPPFTLRYGMTAGTSFAAPVVTGMAAVLRRWFANENGGANPSPALTKAMVIGGAIDLAGGRVRTVSSDGYSNPGDPQLGFVMDPHQGYGLASLARLVDSFANHFYLDQTSVLCTGCTPSNPSWQSGRAVVDPAKKTRLTLVWTDRYSTPAGRTATTYKIVNDLFLKVCTANYATCWWGNTWQAGTGDSQAFPSNSTFPPSDTVNNVEEIIIPAGTFTTGQVLTVQVVVYYLNGDGIDPYGTTIRQDFALFGTNLH